MPHWGIELSYYPPEEYYLYANKMIDAGADSVYGSHTHTIAPHWKYKGKMICYSMGNFLFPVFCMQVPKPQYYPDNKEQYQLLERRWFYPKDFSSPVVSIWRGRNRIGSMFSMNIKERKTIVKHRLVVLRKNNILEMYTGINSKIVSARMKVWKNFYSHFRYRFVNRLLDNRYNVIERLLDKMEAFNIPVEL